jgi:hypothetical protein
MKNIVNHSSVTVLTVGGLFLLAALFVPQPATGLSRSERVGGSWGSNCWKEAGTPRRGEQYCSQNFTCRNCCQRKEDSCKRKYPNRKTACENYFTYCADSKPTKTLLPGGTKLPQAPSGRIKQTPRSSTRFSIQQFMRRFQLRGRGIENLPPLVIPDPEPPARPAFETE